MERIGRYELTGKLGHGGMGVVYRAFDSLLQRTVAVKLIGAQIHDQPGMRERFFREARAAGQLSHKNIITVHDLGEENGQPFLAMEFLEGEDLQHRLNGALRPSLTAKLDIAVQICEGLEYAHSRGVVHRDIKPANIFITTAGVVKILDFGLARLGASQLTNTGMVMGTINYMAPEQVRGEKADHRADIFSTGVLLYEMFSGRKAFEGDSFAATLMKILQEAPEPLDHVDPNVPVELTHIVDRALAKKLEQRYQNMSELRADLQAVRRQFDSPTVLAPMIGPSDPTMLVPVDPSTPGRTAVHSGAGAVGTAAYGGSAARQVSGAHSAAASPRSTVPTARMDSAVRGALSDAGGSAPQPAKYKPWTIAAAAVLAIALIGGAAMWLKSGTPASTTNESTQAATPPVSETAALPEPSSSTSAASGKSGDPLPPAPQPAEPAAPETSRAGRGSERASGRSQQKPGTDTARTNVAAPDPGRRGNPRNQPDAAAAQAKSEPTQTAPPKPAADPLATPTVPVRSGTPDVLPTSPIAVSPPPAAPSAPANNPAPPPPAPEKKGPSAEEAMNELVDRYRAALEARDFNALRRIWPGLTGTVADSHRDQFKNASRIVADISNRQVKLSNGTGMVTFVRRYVVTLDGKDYQQTSTATMTTRQTASGWVIENIQFSRPR